MTAILQSPENRVQGFLGPGHVCTVMGCSEYGPIAKHYKVPIVITGFEPVDMLEGVLWTVRQLEEGRYEVENQYGRAVQQEGNLESRRLIEEVFEICDRKWRGVGIIPKSGFKLRYEYRDYDAARIFEVADIEAQESTECISGQVLRGLKYTEAASIARPLAKACNCTHLDPAGARRWFPPEAGMRIRLLAFMGGILASKQNGSGRTAGKPARGTTRSDRGG